MPKPNSFRDLRDREIRDRIDLVTTFEAWLEAQDERRRSYAGTMSYEARGEKEYLYRRIGKVRKSLGPKSDRNDQVLAAFNNRKAILKERSESLAANMNQLAGVMRAYNLGRAPVTAARVLRELRMHAHSARIAVVGTNALYAYEAMAGVVFESAMTATQDIDLLLDDRNRLRILTEEKEAISLARLIAANVDKSFAQRRVGDYRLTNKDGYMVEFVQPERGVSADTPAPVSGQEDDVVGAPIVGLQWLINAPSVEAIILDSRGFPAPMRAPDPRYFAAHKFWLSEQDGREPAKRLRDRNQAGAVLDLIGEKLTTYPIDDAFVGSLPGSLRDALLRHVEPPEASETPGW